MRDGRWPPDLIQRRISVLATRRACEQSEPSERGQRLSVTSNAPRRPPITVTSQAGSGLRVRRSVRGGPSRGVPDDRRSSPGRRSRSCGYDEGKEGEPHEDDATRMVKARHGDHRAVEGHRSSGTLSACGVLPGTRSLAFVNTMRPQPARGSERRTWTRYQPAIGYSISPIAVAD
jgi:hypothetical protein